MLPPTGTYVGRREVSCRGDDPSRQCRVVNCHRIAYQIRPFRFVDTPIRYTFDGSEPTGASPRYDRPLVLEQSTVKCVRLRRMAAAGPRCNGPATFTVNTCTRDTGTGPHRGLT